MGGARRTLGTVGRAAHEIVIRQMEPSMMQVVVNGAAGRVLEFNEVDCLLVDVMKALGLKATVTIEEAEYDEEDDD